MQNDNQPQLLVDGVHPYDDPVFKNSKDSISLEEIVKKDMAAKGLNPLNKDDIQKYWMSRGVSING